MTQESFRGNASTIRDVVDLAQVSKSQLVLDVGSGFGGITAEALERGAEVVSLDFSMKYPSGETEEDQSCDR